MCRHVRYSINVSFFITKRAGLSSKKGGGNPARAAAIARAIARALPGRSRRVTGLRFRPGNCRQYTQGQAQSPFQAIGLAVLCWLQHIQIGSICDHGVFGIVQQINRLQIFNEGMHPVILKHFKALQSAMHSIPVKSANGFSGTHECFVNRSFPDNGHRGDGLAQSLGCCADAADDLRFNRRALVFGDLRMTVII